MYVGISRTRDHGIDNALARQASNSTWEKFHPDHRVGCWNGKPTQVFYEGGSLRGIRTLRNWRRCACEYSQINYPLHVEMSQSKA